MSIEEAVMLQRIDGPAPLTVNAAEGVGASAPAPGPQPAAPPVAGGNSGAQASAEEVHAAVANANRDIQAFTQSLEFEIDRDTDTVVVRLVDTQDGKVLRQVPSQEMLAIARALERMQTRLAHGEA
jgi:flagellar protein FlaG